MNYEEERKVIAYIFAETGMPDTALDMLWTRQLKDIDFKTAMVAADNMLREKTFGSPKIADFFAQLKKLRMQTKLPSLTITPVEALTTDSSLSREAWRKTDQICPKISGHQQFASKEELDKTNNINTLRREKTFKEIFSRLQSEAIHKVESGIKPQLAIGEVCDKVKVLNPENVGKVKKLIEGIEC